MYLAIFENSKAFQPVKTRPGQYPELQFIS